MKQKHFYAHLVETSTISLELADMEVTKEERVHLIALVEANIHSKVLDTVLSELPEEDKKTFLMHIDAGEHDKVWNHVNSKIKDAEEKIRKEIKILVKEFIQDIREAKSKKA